MNIDIGIQRLPSPDDVQIAYTRVTGQCILTWNKITNTNKQVFYNIYRGISYSGIFYKQNTQPIFLNRYVDNSLSKNPNISYWYKISSLYKENDIWIEGVPSRPFQYKVNNLNKWFNKMNERNFWILKNDGLLFDLYQRKYEGEKCHCYDYLRGQAGLSTCSTCYGTGFLVPYAPPVEIFMRMNNVNEALLQETDSWAFSQKPGFWTISNIRLRNRDLLVSPQGIIFSIVSSYINNVAGYLFHQTCETVSLESNDPAYNIIRKKTNIAY